MFLLERMSDHNFSIIPQNAGELYLEIHKDTIINRSSDDPGEGIFFSDGQAQMWGLFPLGEGGLDKAVHLYDQDGDNGSFRRSAAA